MKQCFKCSHIYSLDNFYKHSRMADGHLNKCIPCTKKDTKDYQYKNHEYIKIYRREYARLPHNVLKRKIYTKTLRWKEAHKKSHKKWLDKNIIKRAAHIIISNAIKSGKLIKQPCEICGTMKKLNAHHDDYTKPLKVRWLCIKHHHEWHINNCAVLI